MVGLDAARGGAHLEGVMNETPLKLNIGCGIEWREGYLNVDACHLPELIQQARAFYPDNQEKWLPTPGIEVIRWDLREPWPWPDASVSEIMADNLLEHFDHTDLAHVLREAMRVLIPGGVMWGRVPDFAEIWRRCVEDLDYDFYPMLGAGPYPHPGENALHNFCYAWGHKQVFTWRMFVHWFQQVGFWLDEPAREAGQVWMGFCASKPGGYPNDDATETSTPAGSSDEDVPAAEGAVT